MLNVFCVCVCAKRKFFLLKNRKLFLTNKHKTKLFLLPVNTNSILCTYLNLGCLCNAPFQRFLNRYNTEIGKLGLEFFSFKFANLNFNFKFLKDLLLYLTESHNLSNQILSKVFLSKNILRYTVSP